MGQVSGYERSERNDQLKRTLALGLREHLYPTDRASPILARTGTTAKARHIHLFATPFHSLPTTRPSTAFRESHHRPSHRRSSHQHGRRLALERYFAQESSSSQLAAGIVHGCQSG